MNKDNEVKKKIDFIQVILIFLIVICVLGFSIFFSTWLRWSCDKVNLKEVISLKQNTEIGYLEEGKFVIVDKLKDFYDIELSELELSEDEAVVLYCDIDNKTDCIYVDYNNFIERNSVNPIYMILIFIILTIVLLVILVVRRKKINVIIYYVFIGIFFTFGIVGASIHTCQIMNYYVFVDDSPYVANSVIVARLKGDNSKSEYRPVSEYEVEGIKYYYFGKKSIKGDFNKQKGEKLTLYYDSVNHAIAVKKENPFDILFIILIVVELIVSMVYVIIGKKRLQRNDYDVKV